MTNEHWPRVKALFQAVVERPAGERHAFLAAATGNDAALRREIESLLASDASDSSFLDRLPVASESVLAGSQTWAHSLLTPGLRVGSYEIVAPLGAGAMGEVYRARDTKLHRDVALKVLPARFALDPDRSARFRREAQLLATLNHSNIAAIYGFEEANGTQALVLELVEGPTLADRIARGPIALEEALAIARQIADAVEAAHEKGIIHRDLKPANIKLAGDGTVKVLDFGLAKVWDGAPRSDLSASARLTATDLGERTILGTPAYMSPEQARGHSLDRRTDIWSFGCVLYEMLTGRGAFGAETISDTLAAILEREPDPTLLSADTPMPIRRLLRRCFEKERKRRLDSAAGARLEIEDAIAVPSAQTLAPAARPARRITPVALAALAGAATIGALVAWALVQPTQQVAALPSRFAIMASAALPLNVGLYDRDLAISTDGRHLVYRAGAGPPTMGTPLMVRATNELEARQIPGVSALGAFFSPDGRWIGFFTPTELMKVPVAGGPAVSIGPVRGASLGASWGDDGTIVFATADPRSGLWRVSADGGEPTELTTPDAAQRGSDHGFPSMLPDGRGVLFTVTAAGSRENAAVTVLDLKTGQQKTLVRGGSQAEYVEPSGGTGAGYLIYAAADTLRAVRFDPARLEVLGDPVTVLDRVMIKPTGAANYAVSRQGTLFYVPGGLSVQMSPRSLVWVDRNGREEPVGAPLRAYGHARISPDGTRVLLGIIDEEGNDTWIWDLGRDTLRRLTFARGSDSMAVWTPDGRRVVYTSDRAGVLNLYSQAADGTGAAKRLTTSANQQFLGAVSPDGTSVVGFELLSGAASLEKAPRSGWGVRLYPLTSVEGSAQTLFEGSFAEFSPDGRHIAYQSNESGRDEVYVRPFPQVDSARWQISSAGGSGPAWGPSGRELFYLDASKALTAVSVRMSGSAFSAGNPAKVFDTRYPIPFPPRPYDVSTDGKRFLMMKDSAASDPNAAPANMVVVEHWFEELKQRMNER